MHHAMRILGSAFRTRPGVGAPALSPEQWLSANALLSAGRATYDHERLRRLAEKDLGPAWDGSCRDLPPHHQVICLAGCEASSGGTGPHLRSVMEGIAGQFRRGSAPEAVVAGLGGWDDARHRWVGQTTSACGRASTAAIACLAQVGYFHGAHVAPEHLAWLKVFDRPLYHALTCLRHLPCPAEGLLVAIHRMMEQDRGAAIHDVVASRYVEMLDALLPPASAMALRPAKAAIPG